MTNEELTEAIVSALKQYDRYQHKNELSLSRGWHIVCTILICVLSVVAIIGFITQVKYCKFNKKPCTLAEYVTRSSQEEDKTYSVIVDGVEIKSYAGAYGKYVVLILFVVIVVAISLFLIFSVWMCTRKEIITVLSLFISLFSLIVCILTLFFTLNKS